MPWAGGSHEVLHAGWLLPAGLCALLADLAGSPSAAVSAEALAALQPIASAQPDALHSCWVGVRAVILRSVSPGRAAGDASGAAMLPLSDGYPLTKLLRACMLSVQIRMCCVGNALLRPFCPSLSYFL